MASGLHSQIKMTPDEIAAGIDDEDVVTNGDGTSCDRCGIRRPLGLQMATTIIQFDGADGPLEASGQYFFCVRCHNRLLASGMVLESEIPSGIDDVDEVGTLADTLNMSRIIPSVIDGEVRLVKNGSLVDITDQVVRDLGVTKLWREFGKGGVRNWYSYWYAWAETINSKAYYSNGGWLTP